MSHGQISIAREIQEVNFGIGVHQPLSSSMRKLLTGYVVNFNGRHGRSGHLFQNRYKSISMQLWFLGMR
jgi:hypothetical protein